MTILIPISIRKHEHDGKCRIIACNSIDRLALYIVHKTYDTLRIDSLGLGFVFMGRPERLKSSILGSLGNFREACEIGAFCLNRYIWSNHLLAVAGLVVDICYCLILVVRKEGGS